MKLRKRFLHFADLKDENPQMYYDSLPKLGKMTEDFLRDTLLDDNMREPEEDGTRFLATNEYFTGKLNSIIDKIVKPFRRTYDRYYQRRIRSLL